MDALKSGQIDKPSSAVPAPPGKEEKKQEEANKNGHAEIMMNEEMIDEGGEQPQQEAEPGP